MEEYFSSPRELFAHLRAQRDKVEMENEDAANRIQTLISNLSEEDALTLMFMFHQCEHEAQIASYYFGRLHQYALTKYPEVVTHDDRPQVEQTDTTEESFHLANEELLLSKLAERAEKVQEHSPKTPLLDWFDTPGYKDLCERYNVTRYNAAKVQCRGCGSTWPSIEDRMLRDPWPKGCDACLQKQKWG